MPASRALLNGWPLVAGQLVALTTPGPVAGIPANALSYRGEALAFMGDVLTFGDAQ